MLKLLINIPLLLSNVSQSASIYICIKAFSVGIAN